MQLRERVPQRSCHFQGPREIESLARRPMAPVYCGDLAELPLKWSEFHSDAPPSRGMRPCWPFEVLGPGAAMLLSQRGTAHLRLKDRRVQVALKPRALPLLRSSTAPLSFTNVMGGFPLAPLFGSKTRKPHRTSGSASGFLKQYAQILRLVLDRSFATGLA